MKIILSRKGFDSKFGGKPSPILPDDTMLSLPIPNMKYTSKKLYDGQTSYRPTQYNDLQLPRNVQDLLVENKIEGITSYKDLMLHLGIEKITDTPEIRQNQEFKKDYYLTEDPLYCHFDPELNREVLNRGSNWKGVFGQDNSSSGHLKNQNVSEDDLFLFYGWYRKTKIEKGCLIYDKSDLSGRHIIFGYLQIGKIIIEQNKDEIKKLDWVYSRTHPHPHLDVKLWTNKYRNGKLWRKANNILYIAKDTLSWNSDYAGWGVFKFDKKLILTETDILKNPPNKYGKQNRSYWKKSRFPYGMKISYHPNRSCWFGDDGKKLPYFKTKSPGQEYVISENEEFKKYVRGLDFNYL